MAAAKANRNDSLMKLAPASIALCTRSNEKGEERRTTSTELLGDRELKKAED